MRFGVLRTREYDSINMVLSWFSLGPSSSRSSFQNLIIINETHIFSTLFQLVDWKNSKFVKRNMDFFLKTGSRLDKFFCKFQKSETSNRNIILQRPVKTIQQFAQLKHEDRRSILRFLDDDQYEDVMKVVGRMPLIDFSVRCEGTSYRLIIISWSFIY